MNAKYFFIWTFICCYIEVCISKMVNGNEVKKVNGKNGNEDDVYVGIIWIHNVLLQEKYHLIHVLMAYFNSIFYILSFFLHKSSSGLLYEMEERNRNAYIDIILITILEIQTLHMTLNKSSNILAFNYSCYIESVLVIYFIWVYRYFNII